MDALSAPSVDPLLSPVRPPQLTDTAEETQPESPPPPTQADTATKIDTFAEGAKRPVQYEQAFF